MFTDAQKAALAAPLASSAVKTRQQAGRSLSYIEGWQAIAEANRIFGFDGWDRETIELVLLGEPRLVGDKYRVGYRAKVRVTIHARVAEGVTATIVRDGCGFGSGIDKDVDQAHESALKEAETDAMKRALMTFGNPFGLALYDKEQRNVADDPPPAREPDPSKTRYLKQCWDRIHSPQETEATLREWWRAESGARRAYDLDQDDIDRLLSQLQERLNAFKSKVAA